MKTKAAAPAKVFPPSFSPWRVEFFSNLTPPPPTGLIREPIREGNPVERVSAGGTNWQRDRAKQYHNWRMIADARELLSSWTLQYNGQQEPPL